MNYTSVKSSQDHHDHLPQTRRHSTRVLIFIFAAFVLVSLVVSVAFVSQSRQRSRSLQTVSHTCKYTRYPDLCVESLQNLPNVANASKHELVHIALNMTLQRVSHALYFASAIAGTKMDTRARSAYEDCIELLDDSIDQLTQSLTVVTKDQDKHEDVLTWLSAAVTNHDTCSEGLDGISDGYVKEQMSKSIKDLSQLVSNCLSIFTASRKNQDFSGVPIQNRRKLLDFPEWVKRKERKLLQASPGTMHFDIVVSKDGNGTYKTIADAVKAAPDYSSRRIVIYVKAGRYDENIKVSRKKINLMFVGDGKGATIVAGSRSVYDNYTTFHTATFAATGAGFIMRDMTIENWAGPWKHQAVALRVGADRSVVYRCNIIGYQDTLYVHSQRQFFRECDIYGTVDFIFGNAAVVLQKCSLWARKPLPFQKNTVTAQNRKDPNQNTGISIHSCRILATSDLDPSKASYPTFLGRPWKMYSRTVVMMSYIGDHVSDIGWLEWNATFALDTLYYGEYSNYGPGAALGKRVTWPGYRVITSADEADKFTVSRFIYGSSWLPGTGVAYLAGLLV